MRHHLPEPLARAVQATLADWQLHNKVQRLWSRDASLWTGADESRWLGWLNIAQEQLAHRDQFRNIAAEIRAAGFTRALLLGMGGSSLCVEVLKLTFGKITGYPEILVLDSTDPAQVRSIESRLDLARTIFIVASKSGSTLEPNIFHRYFFARVQQAVAATDVGRRFIAITDPGSSLEKAAATAGFRHAFSGVPGIGGRYSALSNFGMIPGAIQGLDVARFLERAAQMARACGPSVPADENPGVLLGAILGTLGKGGRDKVTLFSSPGIFSLGAWLEQLLAESTGKNGQGLIPVEGEQIGPPSVYGEDRVFVYLRLLSEPDPRQDAAVEALEKARQPVIRVEVPDAYDLGEEFFRWEIATAVAGSILGINPFDQPDVEASKVETRKLTAEYETTGSLPPESSLLEEGGIRLFADAENAAEIVRGAEGEMTLAGWLRAHLARLRPGDYFALLAYLEMNDEHESRLQAIRHAVRDARRVATCLGFGPRFLHSTGQAYKGGPNSGVFLQITCDDVADLAVPGQKYTFGVVKAAQARGDFQVLAQRHRRALRVHLGPDVPSALAALHQAIRHALSPG